ncbi:MAG: TIM barrel protein [Anaerolineae bacterium]
MRIGLSGAPESARRVGSAHAIRRCAELGLAALEVAWVQKVTITPRGAAPIRAAAEKWGVALSVHAPYYINLNSHDEAKLAASIDRIVAAGCGAALIGARDVVLHLGYYHDDSPADVLQRVATGLVEARERLDAAGGGDVVLRPEAMGRLSQFGDLDEVLSLCRLRPGLAPCVDIAHLHARTGAVNTAAEFRALWDQVAARLGEEALTRAHVHISGIEYGHRGEVRHLAFGDADLDYRAFLEVLLARGVRGTVVVESPARERDALLLADAWREVVDRGAPAG